MLIRSIGSICTAIFKVIARAPAIRTVNETLTFCRHSFSDCRGESAGPGDFRLKLPQFSIATKLYAIFALLATVTVGLSVVAVINARDHQNLTNEFESALAGSQNVDRANGLIYAVIMEARGVYLTGDPDTAGSHADNLLTLSERIGAVIADWQTRMRADDSVQFTEFSVRASQFQQFARELSHIATGAGPQAARDWGDTETNRATQRAMNKDLEQLAEVYAQRAARVYGQIDREIDETAFLMVLLTRCCWPAAASSSFGTWSPGRSPPSPASRRRSPAASRRQSYPMSIAATRSAGSPVRSPFSRTPCVATPN
jgi:hypothetical protein